MNRSAWQGIRQAPHWDWLSGQIVAKPSKKTAPQGRRFCSQQSDVYLCAWNGWSDVPFFAVTSADLGSPAMARLSASLVAS